MRSTAALVLALGLGLARLADSVQQVEINPTKLQHIADRLGVASLLEVGSSAAPEHGESIAATPGDLESGDFEIKCTTSCGFVRSSGVEARTTSASGAVALAAAEDLAAVQGQYKSVEEGLRADPTNQSLQSQQVTLQMQINEKTAALQAAVGGDTPDFDLEGTAAAVAKGKKRIEDLQLQLEKGPNAQISAELDLAKAEVRKLNTHLKAQQHEGSDIDAELSTLNKRLQQLKSALAEAPDDEEIKGEVSEVERALENKAKEGGAFMPKKECYRVCMNPHAPGSSPGSRRLLSEETAFLGDVNNCIRMCVKVMRHLVYNMADKFL